MSPIPSYTPGGGGVSQEQLDASITAAIDALKDMAPSDLDTLKEIATAIGNNPAAYTNLQNGIDFAVAKADNHINDQIDAHQATAIGESNGRWSGDNVHDVLHSAEQEMDYFNVIVGQASDYTAQVASQLGQLDDVALRTLRARYDFDALGGDPGIYTLRNIDGSGQPVVVSSATYGKVFIPIGCHFIVHTPIVQAGGSLGVGFESGLAALTGGSARTAAELRVDGSKGQLIVTNPFTADQPFSTAVNAVDGMAMRINDEPITAGKIDVIAFGYMIGQYTL